MQITVAKFSSPDVPNKLSSPLYNMPDISYVSANSFKMRLNLAFNYSMSDIGTPNTGIFRNSALVA